jgi:teichuronic acid biosynthesis glycosyltransferase TuaG
MELSDKPTVSVIIPTYNRINFLPRAIQSVKNQIYKDWEIVVVDDRSTDNTNIFMGRWYKDDERIRYYNCFPRNTGSPVRPRNFGVAVAKGEYVAFLDSDDFWEPRKLAIQMEYMVSSDVDFSCHNMWVMPQHRRWSLMSTCYSGWVFKRLLRKNFIATSSVILKRRLYGRYGAMDPTLTISHDWDLWLKVASENELYYDSLPLGCLTLHEGSVITETYKRRSQCREIIRRWRDRVDTFHCNDDVDASYYRKVLAYYYLMEVFDVLPEYIKRKVRDWWYSQRRFQK